MMQLDSLDAKNRKAFMIWQVIWKDFSRDLEIFSRKRYVAKSTL